MASIALVLASIDRPATDSVHTRAAVAQQAAETVDAAEWLPGTWLREHVEQVVRSRRLLHLDADGRFREQVRIVSATGEASHHEHAGDIHRNTVRYERVASHTEL